MEYTNSMNIRQFVKYLEHHFIHFLLCGLLFGILGFAISEFGIAPKYSSSVTFVVNQKKRSAEEDINKQQADIQVINTYKDLLTSDSFIRSVRKDIKDNQPQIHLSGQEIKKAIEVTNQQNSQAFVISVTTNNPNNSQYIASSIAKHFEQQVHQKLHMNNLIIYSKANLPDSPSFPDVKAFTIISALAGFVIGLVYGLFKNFVDQRIWSQKFLKDVKGVKFEGVINHIKG